MFQIKLLIVLLFWILTFIILTSCTCVKQTSYISDNEYDGTDAIIKGKVVYTKLMDNKTHSFTVFTILENYTPTVKEKVLKVISPIDEEACGVQFEVNQNWLLFAYKNDAMYTTNRCTRSMEFIPQDEYESYADSFIKKYHKNLVYLKSKQD